MSDFAFTLYLGGKRNPLTEAQVRDGLHPRIEYLELERQWGGKLVSFDDSARADVKIARAQRVYSPYWAMALGASGEDSSRPAFATGEDIGLPLALLQALRGNRRPLHILTHGSYFGSRKARAIFSLLRGASWVHFLCLSESLRQFMMTRLRIPPDRVINVGYGVDLDYFRPSSENAIEPELVVSAGMANRDYSSLASAASSLPCRVAIAADSAWFRSEIDVNHQSLPPHIQARSYGDYQGLRQLYASAAFIVVPLRPANYACGYAVIAEAMAMGKAVIASRTAAPSDYIEEGVTGYYCSPGDIPALREKIGHLLNNPSLAREMGQAARQQMERNFSLDAYVQRIASAMLLSRSQEDDVRLHEPAGAQR